MAKRKHKRKKEAPVQAVYNVCGVDEDADPKFLAEKASLDEAITLANVFLDEPCLNTVFDDVRICAGADYWYSRLADGTWQPDNEHEVN